MKIAAPRQRPGRLLKMALVLASALLLMGAGCSRLDLALRWADTFVMYSVTDYFELSSVQKTEARQEFNTALGELRREDFPKLSAELRRLADLADQNAFTAENVEEHLKLLQDGFLAAGRRFEPMAQKLIQDQVAVNFKQFDTEVMKKYEKDLKRAQDPAQARSKMKNRAEDIVDDTIEYLTPAQKEAFKGWVQQTTPPQVQQVENRRIVLDKFKAVRADEAARRKFVHDFFHNWESLQGAEYLTARAEYQKKIRDFVIQIATSLEEKQRKNLSEKLRARAGELDRLASAK
ncbi:MAG: hypothetical protein KF767_15965 [Bdellovibrionaceae bacterium]|nr:hypothetical protein [Pseudobdellovibrionaceae bacterium]